MARPQKAVTKFRGLERITWADSGTYRHDIIKRHGLHKPLTAIKLKFRFTLAETGTTVLDMDGAVQLLFDELELVAQHKELGKIKIIPSFDGVNCAQFWHMANDILGREQHFSAPTSDGDGHLEFTIPLSAPYLVNEFGYRVDPEDLNSLQLNMTFGDDTDYGTNVDDITNGTIELLVEEIQAGVPRGKGYFVPKYSVVEEDVAVQVSEKHAGPEVRFDGLTPMVNLMPFDTSQTGNAKRNQAGLARKVSLHVEDSDELDDAWWEQLQNASEKDFPLDFTTTRRTGPVSRLIDRQRDLTGALLGDGAFELDLTSTPQQGITAITPASGDFLYVMYPEYMAVGPARQGLKRAGFIS